MTGRHWSDDELLDRLYGISTPSAKIEQSHVEECEECGRRWRALLETRASLAQDPEIPADVLAAQRRQIYARLENGPGIRAPLRWIPAMTAAVIVFVVLVVYERPAQQHARDAADAQLIGEVSAMEQASEPRAAAPLQALFEETPCDDCSGSF